MEIYFSYTTREPHSPHHFQRTFVKEQMYKETIERLRLEWIGLKFNTPHLLPIATRPEWDEALRKDGVGRRGM